ncbi:LIMLP_19325 family protein [Leptospira alexanderi]|uniref:Uncharacterized protein n=1 Tax=Leptospira alexanderi serovar Manhao 3 str. L 60 TaxID=1049759 RepID=V6HWF3_9LEPT|nr:hypothetical protein LEP1GSC062_1608 [Leptospira alexanderi serovar Manhao 3 str. L 60]
MVFNCFQSMPLEISHSDLDEYEKILRKSLNDEDREAILKFTSFRKILTIRKKLNL